MSDWEVCRISFWAKRFFRFSVMKRPGSGLVIELAICSLAGQRTFALGRHRPRSPPPRPGAHKPLTRPHADPAEIQAVGVPAGADGRVGGGPANAKCVQLCIRVAENESGQFWEQMRDTLEEISLVKLCGKDGRVQMVTDPTDEQRKTLKNIGVKPPRRVQRIAETA